jgi:uncharacterized membrane protein
MLPQREDSRWTEERLDIFVGNLLRTGVLTAAAVVLAGGILYLVRHGFSARHLDVFQGEPSDLRSVKGILQDVFSGSSRGIIQLGLLLLIATPVMRVALLVIGFSKQRNRLYVFVSLAVLASLLFSLFGGRF